MNKNSADKLTLVDIALVIFALIVIIGSLGYVLLHKQYMPKSEVSFDFFSADSGYDVSVINSVSKEELMKINGIGEIKASAIISYRDSLNGFSDVYQLLDLNTITSADFERIILYFYFGDETSLNDNHVSEVESIVEDPFDSENASDSEDSETVSRRQVNIITASAVEIAECLLISEAQAEQIVKTRTLIGGYNYVDELCLCNLISQELFVEIQNYLII